MKKYLVFSPLFFFFLSTHSGAWAANRSLQSEATLPQQNLLLKIPELNREEFSFYTWALQRGSKIWIQGDMVDLGDISWPQWDLKQSPPQLINEKGRSFHLALYYKNQENPEQLPLDEMWNPEKKQTEEDKRELESYSIVYQPHPQITVESPRTAPIQRKPVFRCEHRIPKKAASLTENPQVDLCLESLKGLAKEKTQWYVEIQWPRLSEKSVVRELSRSDRLIRKSFLRAGHRYTSKILKGEKFEVVAGKTQIERYPQFDSSALATLPNKNLVHKAPSAEKEREVFHEESLGLYRLRIESFAGNRIEEAALNSGEDFRPVVFLQILPMDENEKGGEASFSEISSPRRLTGIRGQLASWYLSGKSYYSTLISNTGETENYLGFGEWHADYRWKTWPLKTGLRLQKDLVHWGSPLSTTELILDLQYQPEFVKPFWIYTGWLAYGVGGTRSSESAIRLGSYAGLPVGLHYESDKKPYFWKTHAAGILGFTGMGLNYGIQASLQLARLVYPKKREGLFVGLFTDFSYYRAKLQNTSNLEIQQYSDTRFRVGLSVGYAGFDYLSSRP